MKMHRTLTSIFAAGILCFSAMAAHAQSSSNSTDSSTASAPVAASTAAPISAPTYGLFSSPAPALAPAPAPRPSGAAASSGPDGSSRFEVFAGYNFMSNDIAFQDSFGSRQGLNGYAATVTYYANRNIGFMADFSGNNGTATIFRNLQHEDQYYLIFGPVVSTHVGHFRISADAGAGIARQRYGVCATIITESTSDCVGGGETNFAFQIGGSFDWIKGHWGIRILKAEYLFSEFDGEALHNIRVETGVLIRF